MKSLISIRPLQVILAVSMLLCIQLAWTQPNDDIQSLLETAEQLKSTDPVELDRILNDIETRYDQLTESQHHDYHLLQGYRYTLKGEVDKAMTEYNHVIENSDAINAQYKAHYSLANLYVARRDFEKTLNHLDQYLEMADRVTDVVLRENGLVSAAIIYNQLGQYEQGLTYSQGIIDSDAIDRNLCFAYAIKIEANLYINGLSSHLDMASDGIDACESIQETVPANFIRSYIATHWLNEQQPQQTLDLLLLSLGEVEQRNYPRLLAEFYALIGQAHHRLGHHLMAESFAEKTLEVSSEQPFSRPVVNSLAVLSELAQSNSDYARALDYHKRYAEADKAYLDEISAKNLAVQMAERDLKEKNSRIELLNKENQVLQLQQNLDREAAENTRLLLILLSAVIGFIALWALRTKRNQIRFKEMAQCDELTGAFNRRHFSELSNHHLQIAESNYTSVALVMFDLDHFKSINDRFGHPVGDWVLQETINVCKQFCRENDVFGRLGGEEFAVLLPGCNLRHAEQFAEKCRRSIASIDSSSTGHDFSVLASFGVSEATEDGFKLKDVISAADEALYVAKSRGRNQVVCSDQLSESAAPTPDQVT